MPETSKSFDTELFETFLAGSAARERRMVYLDKTDSTNVYLSELVRNGASEPAIVIAESQSCGRGRFGRRWYGEAYRSLMFSFSWPVPEPLKTLPAIVTLATGSALAESVARMTGLKPKLKYPNDLMINGKKTAGILAELKKKEGNDIAVIGIGINVKKSKLPKEIESFATSLEAESGVELGREKLLASFLFLFDEMADILESGRIEKIIERYEQYAMTDGESVTVTTAGSSRKGTTAGIGSAGELLVKIENGDIVSVCSGEVMYDNFSTPRV